MVSSFFITLASPHRATVTQQQPALQAHSAPATRDKQHAAVRVNPGDSIPSLRQKKEDHSLSEPHGSGDRKGHTHAGSVVQVSDPQSLKPAQSGTSRGQLQEDNRGAAGIHDNTYF